MHTTPVSLLEELRRPSDRPPWERFVKLYYPLIYHWARRAGASPDDAADLVQEVLIILIRALPGFEYDASRSFRGWLRRVTLNAWHRRRRVSSPTFAAADLDRLAGPDAPPDEVFEEREYRQRLALRALALMKSDFEPATWKACWASVVEGRPAAEIAEQLNISVNSVYLAKSRVLRRLHKELDGFLD